MLIHFVTFSGFGTRRSFDIKLKGPNGRVILRHFLEMDSPPGDDIYECDNGLRTELEIYFREFSDKVHKAGFQKFAAWIDLKVKEFDEEYTATYLWDAIRFIEGLNSLTADVDPIN